MTLGERLSEYRTNAKMSQDILAEKLGVTRQTVSKWETDQSTPEFNKILPLCEVFGITTDELIKGEKDTTTNTNKEENDNNSDYEKRNKKKAIVISISIFLFLIGTFSLPYMVESLNYNESHAVMITTTLWSIAVVMLVYFFVSHPNNKIKKKGIAELSLNEDIDTHNLERKIIQVIVAVFLLVYIVTSFTTMAWHFTWILWLVCLVVVTITKLIFELRKGANNAK